MIERVLAPNPGPMTGTGTNTYVVPTGRGAVVIDPGPDDAPEHLEAIEAAAAPHGGVAAILVTHGHIDHLPGAFPLGQRNDAPVLGHRLLPGVDQALADGEAWRLGDVEIVALETPGHTDDSLCYWMSAEGALFTGDLIAGAGTVVVDPSPGGLAKYFTSLRRVEALAPRTIYPGHGPRVEDGRARAAEYLAHRQQREDQVLAALADGLTAPEEMVRAIYPDVIPPLVPMAARNLRAHLWKLRDEGRVVEERPGRWRLAEPSDRAVG